MKKTNLFFKLSGVHKRSLQSSSGFTLVELMVVVAIIGILSAIAIPQFQTYQAKSRTSEAKLALAGLYTAEVSFQGETGTYATCLFDMGHRPSNAGTTYDSAKGAEQRYYTYGFQTASRGSLGAATTALVSCTEANSVYLGKKSGTTAGKDALSFAATTKPALTSTVNKAGNLFIAGAVGTVDTNDVAVGGKTGDQWSIDQDKTLKHVRNGY